MTAGRLFDALPHGGGDVSIVRCFTPDDRSQAEHRCESAAGGEPIGGERQFEGPGNPGDVDPLARNSAGREGKQGPVEHPTGDGLVVPRDDDGHTPGSERVAHVGRALPCLTHPHRKHLHGDPTT